MLRTLIATLLVALVASAAATAAGLDANVIAVNQTPGSSSAEVVLAIPKGIDTAARQGADFGLRLTITFVSVNNTVETFESGRISLADETARISTLDENTVAVVTNIVFYGPIPGTNPSFSATAELLNPGSG